jgi:hypothetical protein
MSKPSVKAQAFHKSHISQIGAKNKANIVEPVKIVGAQMSALGYTPTSNSFRVGAARTDANYLTST